MRNRDEDRLGKRYGALLANIPDDNDRALLLAAEDLLEALEETFRHLVTPKSFPDKGKGRTQEQQWAHDLMRNAIAKAKGARHA